MEEGMAKREKVYLKDVALWGEIDHEGSAEMFPEAYAKLDTLTHGSEKKLVWKCLVEGHGSWESTIKNRSVGHGCPTCGRIRAATIRSTPEPGKSLEDAFPSLASEWDYDKNSIAPYGVSASSHKKVWWKCVDGHSWPSTVGNRSIGNGCPFCSGLRASDSNRLSLNRPEIAREWDFDMNELTPYDVTVYSDMKAWWECSGGHSWRARIADRSSGKGCPFCSGLFVSDSNRLSLNMPNLASEWDFDKNDLTPFDVTFSSHRGAWWVCSDGHSWRTSINNRSRGSGCPQCAKKYGRLEKRFGKCFAIRGLTPEGYSVRLPELSYESGRKGVEVDIPLTHASGNQLLIEIDGEHWHKDLWAMDTYKSELLSNLDDNTYHARVRLDNLPFLDFEHERFGQWRYFYEASDDSGIDEVVSDIVEWFNSEIGE